MRTILLLLALAAPPAQKPESVCVVVVREGSASVGHVVQIRRDLRAALSKQAVAVMEDSAAVELARLVSPDGACDPDCEERMRRELPGATLVLVRLSTIADRFLIRVSNGRSEIKEIGKIEDLSPACRHIAAQLAGAPGALRFDADPGAVFLDGKPFRARAGTPTPLAPGRYILRFGDGTKPNAMSRIDVRAGETLVVQVPPRIVAAPVSKPPVSAKTEAPAPAPAPARASSNAIEGAAGLAFGVRSRSVHGEGASIVGARFAGTGVAATVRYERGAWIADVRLQALSFRGSRARIAVPDGSSARVHGGDSVHVAAQAGRRLRLPRAASLDLLAGVDGSVHRSQDLQGPDGALGAFPSHQRLGARVEVAVASPLGSRASVSAAAAVLPWSAWSETPRHATGSSPRPSPAPELRVGAAWSFAARASIDMELGATWQRVDFRGPGSGAFGSSLSNARVDESAQWMTVTLRRGF